MLKRAQIAGRECKVYFSEVDGKPYMVKRNVDVRYVGRTGFGWRKVPIDGRMAKQAIELSQGLAPR